MIYRQRRGVSICEAPIARIRLSEPVDLLDACLLHLMHHLFLDRRADLCLADHICVFFAPCVELSLSLCLLLCIADLLTLAVTKDRIDDTSDAILDLFDDTGNDLGCAACEVGQADHLSLSLADNAFSFSPGTFQEFSDCIDELRLRRLVWQFDTIFAQLGQADESLDGTG
ncbi:hypothetical protein [Tengunoibacter tsumagoiensis]|uniref:hypothetical protein n=1 Tax=Tengunoibacter tsumagoiensis TaxID=2014871 RepID=UPI000F84C89E|nr:hypothetical protein [Tengunoibacter tsumagoiensis]